MEKPNFYKINILIADADLCLTRVLMQNLRVFGFRHIHHVKSGVQAIHHIRTYPVDIIITEWPLPVMDGIELVTFIRKSKDSPSRTIPIIMLTGKGEEEDVLLARDQGITEFIIKPFSAQTIFERIKHLVDSPRPFILSENFIGPDRRRRAPSPEEDEKYRERRTVSPKPAAKIEVNTLNAQGPTMLLPDNQLKHKMGVQSSLSSIITPTILAEAQKAIDNMSEESMQWIKQDLITLEKCHEKIRAQEPNALEELVATTLSIKSRSGTFGYNLASEVARMLYLFSSNGYDQTNPQHDVIVGKHVEVLKVIFANNLKHREGVGEELLAELQRVVQKAAAKKEAS